MIENKHDFTIPDLCEKTMCAILEVISDGVWIWDASSGKVFRTASWYLMLGYEPSHPDGDSVFAWETLIHPDDLPRVMAQFDCCAREKVDHFCIEYRCRTRAGDYLWTEDRGQVVARKPDGSIARMIGAHRDINARKELLARLESRNHTLERQVEERTQALHQLNRELQAQLETNRQLAETDGLTKAANRYCAEKKLQQECDRAWRFGNPLTLAIIDIDNFKEINDQRGHSAGDDVLSRVVELVQQHARPSDLVARWGGDEFMVILPETPLESAHTVVQRMGSQLASASLLEGMTVTLSIGLAEYHRDDTPQQLTMRADQALYRAKQNGKNLICH